MAERFEDNILEEGKKKESFLATPFNKPLTETEFGEGDKLRYLAQNKDKIVRTLLLSKTGREEDKFSLEEYKAGREVFRKMKEEYGIAIPKADLVMGREKIKIRSSPKKMFMIVDRVYGEVLSEAESLSKEVVAEADKFFTSILKFYYDVYKNGGDFWIDLENKNLIFGHIKGEDKNRVYIFDVEPFIVAFDPSKPIGDFKESDNFYFNTVLGINIPAAIRTLERKSVLPAKLVEARKALKNFVDNMREEDARVFGEYGSIEEFLGDASK